MTKFYRKKILLVRAAGADAFVTGDAVLATGIELTPLAGDTVNRALERPYHGASEDLLVNAHQSIQFSVEFAAGATAGTQPWAKMLTACGFSETLSDEVEDIPGTSQDESQDAMAVYNPITGGETAIKLGLNIDGILHVIDNALGSFTLELAANAIPRFQFSMTGVYAAPTDTAQLTGDYKAFEDPQIATQKNTPKVSIFGESDIPLTSFSFDLGAEVVHRSPINADAAVSITGRNPSGSLTLDAQAVSKLSPVDRAHSGAKGAVSITHGIAGGRQITLAMPNVAVGRGVSYADDNGILQQQLPLQLLPQSGNDEIKITVI